MPGCHLAAKGVRVLATVLGLGCVAEARSARADSPFAASTYDYEYDGSDAGAPARAWAGRAFVHEKVAATPAQAVPLVVFLHGLNESQVKHRFMGSPFEDDLRQVVAELIDSGSVAPLVLAAPSSVVPEAVSMALFAWPGFDLDHFVARTGARLHDMATIDPARVVVVGHSGAGCNVHGGLASALGAKVPPYAALSVDTCMTTDMAQALVRAAPTTRVYVTWQVLGWRERTFDWFVSVFQQTLVSAALPLESVRLLDVIEPTRPHPHDAVVRDTLEKYLPSLFPGPTAVAAAEAR